MSASPSPRITGLDGVTRDWDDVFATGHIAGLGLCTPVGYVVRRTYFPDVDGIRRPHEDVAEFGERQFGEAIDLCRAERDHEGGYAVVDRIHRVPSTGALVRLNG
jgi:hypothetical protein